MASGDFDPAAFAAFKANAAAAPAGDFDPAKFAAYKAAAAAPDMGSDVLKSGAVGVGKGLIGLAGLPADAASLLNRGIGAGEGLLNRGVTAAGNYIGGKLGLDPATVENVTSALPGVGKFGSADLQRRVEQITGPFYEPKTTAGQYAQSIGEFAPAVAGGPEGLASRIFTRAVIPGSASEAAGEATEGTALEPYARGAAALAGGVGGAKAVSAMSRPSVTSAVGNALAGKFGPGAIKPGTAAADFNIPLTTGEAAGDFSQIQYEQAALRGGYGEKAQRIAQDFFDKRAAASQEAVQNVGAALDQFGANVVDSPLAAGEMASEGLKQAAAIKKAGYKADYDEFANMPGVIHAGALEGIGQKIKGQLTLGDNPVIVDDVTTPVAAKAIKDIEQNIDRLKVQNRADPFGQPAQENVFGVNLKGIDQTRKRLVQFNQDARGSAMPGQTTADMRATSAIIKAFDGHIEDAVANGLFSGDDRALDVLRQARAGYADYQKVFRPVKGDGGVGSVMDKIVNREDGAGATAGEVANFLYGASGTGAAGLSSRVATRMRDILGADSPEWSGIRQGMWKRLTQATEGKDAYGPQKISQRIFEFVNGAGRPTAEAMFSPQELSTMRRLASALKETVPPPGSINYSGTAYTAASIIRNSAAAMTDALGHGIAGHVGGWMTRIGRGLLADRASAKKVTHSLYGKPPALPPTNVGALPVVTAANAGAGQPLALPPPTADDNNRRKYAAGQAQGGPVNRQHGGRVNPANIHPSPTEAQKQAGNYAKDHVRIHGLDIAIENAKGAERKGVDRDGKPWSVKMPAHYGYIKGTVGKDKDHVDVYLGPHKLAPKVFVVDQIDADSRLFDEHKAFIGFASKMQAINTYHKAFSDGRAGERFGHITEMTVDEFKRWLASGDTTKPLRYGVRDAA